MRVRIKGNTIILSITPGQDVPGAILLMTAKEQKIIDVVKGQKEYQLPEGMEKKDVEALYIRII